MRSRYLFAAIAVLTMTGVVGAQEAKRQLIVPLSEGGFVSFKNETSWTDPGKTENELQNVPAVLSSQAILDDQVIHRVLEDKGGSLDIESVSRPPASTGFVAATPKTMNVGFSASAWWVRFTLRNTADQPRLGSTQRPPPPG